MPIWRRTPVCLVVRILFLRLNYPFCFFFEYQKFIITKSYIDHSLFFLQTWLDQVYESSGLIHITFTYVILSFLCYLQCIGILFLWRWKSQLLRATLKTNWRRKTRQFFIVFNARNCNKVRIFSSKCFFLQQLKGQTFAE